MKRFFFISAVFIFGLFFLHQPAIVNAAAAPAARYAACDLCGYCPPDRLPSTWNSCRTCLYPSASSNAGSRSTLKIDTTTNTGPTPFPGRQYTVIGCIKTNLASFNQEGAAASVVQVLLNIIFSVIGAIAFLYLIYGSFVVLTSQSEPEKLNYGKRLIYGAVIGLIFSLMSGFIVNFIASGILKIPGF